MAALIKAPYHNTTLGRNLFDSSQNNLPFAEKAFLFNPDERNIGIITNEYCYLKDMQTGKETFTSSKDNAQLPLTLQTISDKNILQSLTNAYYETGKYMLLHNTKKSVVQ